MIWAEWWFEIIALENRREVHWDLRLKICSTDSISNWEIFCSQCSGLDIISGKADIQIDPKLGGWQIGTAGKDSVAIEWVEDITKSVLEVKDHGDQAV